MIDTAEITTKTDAKTCNHCNISLTYETMSVAQSNSNSSICRECKKQLNADSNPKHNPENNPQRMYVNGKYIPKRHPLYKSGTYQSFGDAAFAALEKDTKVKEGYVYAISNAAWPEWIKIGKAVDADDRLNSYQTSSPMRDYKLIHSVYFEDRNAAEIKAHKYAAIKGRRKNEWFNITKEEAIEVLWEIL